MTDKWSEESIDHELNIRIINVQDWKKKHIPDKTGQQQ